MSRAGLLQCGIVPLRNGGEVRRVKEGQIGIAVGRLEGAATSFRVLYPGRAMTNASTV
jgi:hypothetical protein